MEWKNMLEPQYGKNSSGGEKEKGSCEYEWIVYLWVFDDRAHRRHLSASEPALCSLWTILQGCLEACLSHKSETQHAVKLWGVMSLQFSFKLLRRKEAISPLLICLPFFCVLFTWTHWISFFIMRLLLAAKRWILLHNLRGLCPLLSVLLFTLLPLSLTVSITLQTFTSQFLSFI